MQKAKMRMADWMFSRPHYREFPPGPLLAAAVECFWTSTVRAPSGAAASHRVLPDKCMDLLFDFTAIGHERASVIGTMTRPLTFTTTGSVDFFGVRFRPGYLPVFLAMDAAELTDGQVDLTNYWGRLAREVWHRLIEVNPADRVRLLQEILCCRVNGRAQIDPFIHHCVTRIEAARGGLRISELEKSTGLSTRQLERKFARHVGISPKTFARIARFKGVMTAADNLKSRNWVTLAGDFGFADQPHLVREFKTFSGHTPVDYLAANKAPVQNVGFLQDAIAVSD